jgi:hypothetical protein
MMNFREIVWDVEVRPEFISFRIATTGVLFGI